MGTTLAVDEVAAALEGTPTDKLSPRDKDNHETSAVQMPDTKSSLGLPKEKISAGLTVKLVQGFETYYGGLFLIIPFLLQVRVWRFARDMWTDLSSKGLSALQVYLLLLFTTLGGIKNLNRLRDVQEIGLAVLAGLPKIPSPAVLHNHLARMKLAGLANVKLSTARALRRIGLMVSRMGELHPQALSEPYGNLSAHTAPITQQP